VAAPNLLTLEDRQEIFAKNVSSLIIYLFGAGYRCSLGEVYRTPEQAAFYAKVGKGIADSLHCKRLAIDINLFNSANVYLQDSKDYEPLGLFWEKLHPDNEWGGRWKHLADGNHFQMKEKS
jgi:hypothetical protein